MKTVLPSCFLIVLSLSFPSCNNENNEQRAYSPIPAFESVPQLVSNDKSLDKLIDQLELIKTYPELKHATWAFTLASLDSNKVLIDYNGNKSLVPASILKAITTGVGMHVAGPEYRFQTRLQYSGTIDTLNRTLNGNIYIKGGGDPTLGSKTFGNTNEEEVLKKWRNAIKGLGVDTINGAIIADASLFDNELISSGWAWEDMQSEYCIGACGLSFRENMFDLFVCRKGDSINYSCKQLLPDFNLQNYVIASKEKDNVLYLSGSPFSHEKILYGQLGTQDTFVVRSSMPDPALYCSYTLYNNLLTDSLIINDGYTSVRLLKGAGEEIDSLRHTFHRIYSPPLEYLVRHTNTESQNFYAETILKLLAVHSGRYGSAMGGVRSIYDYFEKDSIDMSGVYLVDGSGLSRFNTVTTNFMVKALSAFHTDTGYFNYYYSTLAIAGRTGTMKRMCKGTPAEGNVHAKSGYMGRVRSYTGYVHDQKGELYAFSMIANNYTCSPRKMRRHFEDLMILISEIK